MGEQGVSAWDDENRWYIGERAVVVAVVLGWIALRVLL